MTQSEEVYLLCTLTGSGLCTSAMKFLISDSLISPLDSRRLSSCARISYASNRNGELG